MKTLSVLLLTVLVFSIGAVEAQIKVFDGRIAPTESAISKAEREFIQKEVNAREKEIKEFGAKESLNCTEDSFVIIGSGSGSFTKRYSKQKAYLYSICLQSSGNYSNPLGGLIIVEKGKTIAHFVYAYRWFDWMKSFADVNSNGFSELMFGFTERKESVYYTRNVGFCEVKSSGLENIAVLTSRSFLSDNEKTLVYTGYVKTGKTPGFYAEEFELTENGKYVKTRALKKVAANKETDRIFTRL